MAVTAAAALLVMTMVSANKSDISQPMRDNAKMGGHPASRPTVPTQMHIDKPVNTALRSEAAMINGSISGGVAKVGGGILETLHKTAEYLESTYATEAVNHPGVRLVAHTVA